MLEIRRMLWAAFAARRAQHARQLLACLAAVALAGSRPAAGEDRFEYTQTKMGAQFKLLFYSADKVTANRAAEAAFARVDQLNDILSDYQPESELSRLSRSAPSAQPVALGDDLWAVLSRAQSLARDSDGAFDVTVGPYVKLWRRARRDRQMPSAQRLEQARQAVGYQGLQLAADGHTARLLKPAMQLDLGGIAMGYTVDEVLKVLAVHGIRRALVDGSGDVGVSDPPPGKAGWTIGIAPPAADEPPARFVTIANAAITTSGDAFQHVEIDGQRYSHIVDPRTGLGLTDRASVTLIAPDCLTADSLATAVCVLGPKRGLALVAQTPGAEALVITSVDGKLQAVESPGFRKYDSPAPADDPAPAVKP